MMKEETPSLWKLIVVIIASWFLFTIVVYFIFEDWTKSGSFGDTFGAVNSLFSGLALGGIIFTIYLQKKELSLQRKELQYTREELKRSADAQEFSGRMMNEQLRINNIPFLQYSSQYIGDDECIIISNNSESPAFDIDIWIFMNQINDISPFKDFIDKYVREDSKEFIKFNEKDLLDEEVWGISDRGIYNHLPTGSGIKIPIYYPIDFDYFEVFIQFRDVLNNNYYQLVTFSNSNNDIPFIDDEIKPKVLQVTKRFDFTTFSSEKEKIEDLPEYLQELVKLCNCSIYALTLKNRLANFTVENKWDVFKT